LTNSCEGSPRPKNLVRFCSTYRPRHLQAGRFTTQWDDRLGPCPPLLQP
jgi:hypothetical protein